MVENITGKWDGVLDYGKEYGQFSGEKLFFELDIFQNHNTFTGIAQDLKGFGANEYPASIEGEQAKAEIRFTKIYERERIFSEHWEAEYTDFEGLPIEYFGVYDEQSELFEGTWKITEKFKILFFIPWKVVSQGTWSMKRKV